MSVPQLRFKDDKGREFPAWKTQKIADVCNRVMDGTHFSPKSKEGSRKYLTSKNIRNDGLSLADCSYISEEEHQEIYKKCPVRKGDMLLTKDGANTGNCCINTLDEEISLLSSVAVLIGKNQILNNQFLLQIFQGSIGANYIRNAMAGQAISRITLEKINNFSFRFPCFQEQTKIANFLTTVDEKISQLTQKCDLLTQYKKGVMQQIFSQALRFRDDDGQDFSEWEDVTLDELLDYEQPTKYLVASTEYSDKYKIPVLTAGKTFILGYTDETTGILSQGLPVIIFDDFTTAFKFVPFPFKAKSSAMKILRLKGTTNSIQYIYAAMQLIDFPCGDEHKRYWISEYSKISIPLPCVAEQTKIASFLTAIDDKIAATQAQLTAAKQYKQGLLQQMFV